MADEVSYDVKFRAIAETSGIDTLEGRLKKLREEISQAQKAQPGGSAPHQASWTIGAGGDPSITEGRKSAGNHWSSNPEVIRKMQEAKKLQEEINRLRAQEKSEPAVKPPAVATAAGLDAAMQTRKGLQGGAAIARMAGTAGLPTGELAAMASAGATAVAALGAVTAAIAAFAVAGAAAGVAIVAGANKAGDAAKQLDSVGGVARERMKRDMGSVGEIVNANSDELVQYSKEMGRVKSLVGNFFTGLGVEAMPALEKVIGPLSNLKTGDWGASLGRMISGIFGAEKKDAGESDQKKDKREDLAKQSELLEAQARGDKREVRNLMWKRNWEEALNAGAPDDAARRFANAKDAAEFTKKFSFSDLGTRGGSMKESLIAAGASPSAVSGITNQLVGALNNLRATMAGGNMEVYLKTDDE